MKTLLSAVLLFSTIPSGFAQTYLANLPIHHRAIGYFEQAPDDPVAHLAKQLESGSANLAFDTRFGYLKALLQRLDINPDSQALVFSKSSFQAAKISPRNPRAIYFNDQAAIGFVPGGNGIEVAGVDPKQGAILYSLNRDAAGKPVFKREEICLTCHQGPSTLGVPGFFIGSVFPNADGMPAREGAIVTDHRTPFEDRWGGWYVNAAHGEQKDRANAVASSPAEPDVLDSRIDGQFRSANYLTPTSDIVALMTFEHQTQMIDFFTRLNWDVRIASPTLNADLEATAAYMLFIDEAPLREPIEGVSTFTKTFPQRGPRDQHGRSLRDFDLRTRLFRYPLSYMIYSPQLDALPDNIRDRLYRLLYAKLSGPGGGAILAILSATKPSLPAWWPR